MTSREAFETCEKQVSNFFGLKKSSSLDHESPPSSLPLTRFKPVLLLPSFVSSINLFADAGKLIVGLTEL